MKKEQNNGFAGRCRRLHRFKFNASYLVLLLLIVAAGQVRGQTGRAPVQTPVYGFGIDWDGVANTYTASPGTYTNTGDWFEGPPNSGTGDYLIMPNSPPGGLPIINPLYVLTTQSFKDIWTGVDPTIFTGSTKVHDPYGPEFTWGPGISPNKNEIERATIHMTFGSSALGGNPNDIWCIFSADRQVNNGEAYIDFEFLQKTLTMVYTDPQFEEIGGYFSSAGTDGTRTEGDILVTIMFTNGGNVPTPVVQRWQPVGDGWDYVTLDPTTYAGEVLMTSNQVEVFPPWQPYGQPSYDVNQFAEGAINLSAIMNFTSNSCGYISSVFVRTKTSQSATAELKDFPGAPYQVNIGVNEITPICPADPNLASCSTWEQIQAAYTTWRNGFTYTGGVAPITTNIDQLPTTPSTSLLCGGMVSFTYEVDDDCAAPPVSCTSTFTVQTDYTNPTASNPDPLTVQCIGDVPTPNIEVVDDEFDACGTPVVAFVSDVSNGQTCPEIITRTYSVTDLCGNFINVTQIITVDDNTAPVFDQEPSDISYQCIEDVPEPGMLTWNDNCDGTGQVLGSDVSDGNTCPEIITRTWSYTDACGNNAYVSQVITVDDTELPIITGVPADSYIDCPAEPVFANTAEATDNCTAVEDILLTYVDEIECPLDSPYKIATRTWTATDLCGNSSTAVETIYINACYDCSLTQGFYGNAGGTYCNGQTTLELLTSLLSAPNPTTVEIGGTYNNKTRLFIVDNAQCIINILPGGGASKIIPEGTWTCGNMGPLLKNGVLNNALLAQTLTLALNLRLDTDLGSLVIQNGTFFTRDASDCSNPETSYPVLGTEVEWTLPTCITQSLGNNPTVQQIYNLANNALMGNNTSSCSLTTIYNAVNIINDAFDECKFIYFCDLPGVTTQHPKGNKFSYEIEEAESAPDLLEMSVVPNPFTESTEIRYKLSSDSRISLEVYNLYGTKVATLFEGEAKAGFDYTYRFDPVGNNSEQVFLIVLRTNFGTVTRRIINTY